MKKLFKLEKNDLRKIVIESVNNVLKDYSKIRTHASFDNPISQLMKHPLSEGLIRTYPIDTTIKYIKKYFQLSDEEIYKLDAENGEEQIVIRVPIVGDNLTIVKKAFALCGYYLGYPKEETLKPNTIYELQFEKRNEQDVSESLRQNEKILYHITPRYYVDKIRHIGLSPRSKNSNFGYPSRTYFVLGSAKQIVKYVAMGLNDANNSQVNNGQYSVISLNIEKIPNRVKFYLDPNTQYSIYTMDNIPPSAIMDIEDIEV